MKILFALSLLGLLSALLVVLILILRKTLQLKRKVQELITKTDELKEMIRLSSLENQNIVEKIESIDELNQGFIAFVEKWLGNRRGGTPKWNH